MIRIRGTEPKGTSLHIGAKILCTHSRVVDYVLTKEGTKTGQLVCLECTAMFPDPTLEKQAS
jgi:hypothetical protein